MKIPLTKIARYVALLAIPLLTLASACAPQSARVSVEPKIFAALPYTHSFVAMGAPWVLKSQAPLPPALAQRLEDEARLYDETFSDWNEGSELRRLEKQGLTGDFLRASALFIEGLSLSQQAWKETNGAFDPTVGAVLWKIRDHPIGLEGLRLRPRSFRFEGEDPQRLSFGGIAKGMVVGALALLWARVPGTEEFEIDAGGGNLARFSRAHAEVEWTSRSHSVQGAGDKAHQHIVNPARPLESFERSVVLICRSSLKDAAQWPRHAALADAWTKALILHPKMAPLAGCKVLTAQAPEPDQGPQGSVRHRSAS